MTNPKKIINIDKNHLVSEGYLSSESNKSDFNEQFRHIKRTIINNAFGTAAENKVNDNANLVMISSANKGEGKTFVAINLALISALEKDKTVLLIDSNVINPQINEVLDFECDKGLIEYLLGEVDNLSEVIYNTNIPNFKIIPAGKPHFLTNELLASERMKTLTMELSTRYSDRLVIFDSPEINNITETPVLAGLMGQGLIVAECRKTTMSSLKKAKESLPEKMVVGVVFNKTLA